MDLLSQTEKLWEKLKRYSHVSLEIKDTNKNERVRKEMKGLIEETEKAIVVFKSNEGNIISYVSYE